MREHLLQPLHPPLLVQAHLLLLQQPVLQPPSQARTMRPEAVPQHPLLLRALVQAAPQLVLLQQAAVPPTPEPLLLPPQAQA